MDIGDGLIGVGLVVGIGAAIALGIIAVGFLFGLGLHFAGL